MGRPSLLQKRGWRNICLCERPHFLATSWRGAASPCCTSKEQPEPSENTPAPCVQRYARRGDLSWAESNIRPPQLCIASLIPLPSSRKPRLPLFIRTLITQSKSPGLQFPLQRRCWLLCWRWSLIILVMSGWYVPPAGIPAGGAAPQAALPVSSSEGWKKGLLAVLCPCGETTSRRSRASHFRLSPQMPFEKVPGCCQLWWWFLCCVC